MKTIHIFERVGAFAEDKDIARKMRLEQIISLLENKEEVVLDFQGVEGATQSFIHALISELIREFGSEVLERISFKNCNDNLRKIIDIVVEYMQI